MINEYLFICYSVFIICYSVFVICYCDIEYLFICYSVFIICSSVFIICSSVFLHVELVGSAVLIVLHHGVEA